MKSSLRNYEHTPYGIGATGATVGEAVGNGADGESTSVGDVTGA